jgi:hypothetical protein
VPSIATIVADLNGGAVPGIGAKPDSGSTTSTAVISGTCRVKELHVNMTAAFSGTGRLSCTAAGIGGAYNGCYVHFQDDWSTVGTMDLNHLVVASGNFSGCAYHIYKSAPTTYKCVHIARPGGVGANALVNLMDNYAQQKGWTRLQTVSTVGVIGVGGASEVFVVSQLFHNNRIDTIRLAINNQDLIVGRQLTTSGT